MFSAHHAHVQAADGLAVGSIDLLEGVAVELGDDADVGRIDGGEGHAHVAYAGGGGRAAHVDDIALLVDELGGGGNGGGFSAFLHCGLPERAHMGVGGKDAVFYLGAGVLVHLHVEGPAAADGADEEFRQAVRAEGDVGGEELLIFGHDELGIDLALTGLRVPEGRGIHRGAHPLLVVVVRGHGLFAAAELLLRLFFRAFHPLVELHLAFKGDGGLAYAEGAVGKDVLGVRKAGHMDDLAGEGGAEIGGIAHDLRLGLCFVQCVAGGYEVAFVPPEQNRTGHEQGKPHADAGERIAEPREETDVGGFRVGHTLPPYPGGKNLA